MFINRYNIHFYDNKSISVEKISAVRFCMKKPTTSSFTQDKKEENKKPFIDFYKEAEERYNNQKVKIK